MSEYTSHQHLSDPIPAPFTSVFELRPDWQISCMDGQLRPEWYRTDADNILDLFDMYGTNRAPEDEQAIAFALTTGAGGMMINLPIDMYQRIKARV